MSDTVADLPEDRPARAEVEGPQPLAPGAFRPYERYRIALHHDDGTTDIQSRDIVRAGHVVGVLGYDPDRDVIVLIRQFRFGAHLVHDRGDMVEIVAGIVEKDEDFAGAARRECEEEAGVAPRMLVPMMRFVPSPGVSDEFATLYLGILDSRALPERAGEEAENERTYPFTTRLDDALAAIAAGRIINGYVIAAVHWLALHRAEVPALIAKTEQGAPA